MRITRNQLRQLIREEISRTLSEQTLVSPEDIIASRPAELQAWAEQQDVLSNYIVKKGDTLSSIRDNLAPDGTTIDDIVRATDECSFCYDIEDPDTIQPGQEIQIPTKIMPYRTPNGWVTARSRKLGPISVHMDLRTPLFLDLDLEKQAEEWYSENDWDDRERRSYGFYAPHNFNVFDAHLVPS